MTVEQYIQGLNTASASFKQYMNIEWPKHSGEIAVRFINGNFRAQGWQGNSFQPWRPLKKPRSGGSILRKTGHLAGSFYFTVSPGQTNVKTLVPYAKAHNEGFTGSVNIPASIRQIKTVKGIGKQVSVKAHTRKMNLPKRQFMPTSVYDSPVFFEAIKRETLRGLKNIFNHIQ